MAKENKNTAKITFNDDRVLNTCEQFKIARERLITWVDELGTKTLSVAFSGGREGVPFSALNLGILSTIGQGGIRERWLKACAEKGRDNVNIGDFILANMVQETEAEKKSRIEREKAETAIKTAADTWEHSVEAVLDKLPDVDFINGKKSKITHTTDGEPIENGEAIFAELLKRAEARAESENA